MTIELEISKASWGPVFLLYVDVEWPPQFGYSKTERFTRVMQREEVLHLRNRLNTLLEGTKEAE